MANKHNSLSHTKWLCKYHIVFTPKYRRKIEFNQYKRDIVNIIKKISFFKKLLFVTISWRVAAPDIQATEIKKILGINILF